MAEESKIVRPDQVGTAADPSVKSEVQGVAVRAAGFFPKGGVMRFYEADGTPAPGGVYPLEAGALVMIVPPPAGPHLFGALVGARPIPRIGGGG